MKDPVVWYSIQSYLAYYINEEYYRGEHYVWVAPYFDSAAKDGLTAKVSVTSNPKDIYNAFSKDVYTRDNHYTRGQIESNINGLIRGAHAKRKAGVITETQEEEIKGMIKTIGANGDYHYFQPLIYVIPHEVVKTRVKRVPYAEAAMPLSPEYKINDLQSHEFDVILLPKGGLE